MKGQLLLIGAFILCVELFLFNNGSVLFLGVAVGLYIYSFKKEEKSYVGLAIVFAVLAIMSMVTLQWLVPVAILYWLYQKYWRKEQHVFGAYTTPDTPYAWRDEAIFKLFGTIVIDTTKTILPLEPAFISIVQGIGKTTIYVPYDVCCTIVVSQGFGRVAVNGQVVQDKRMELEPDSRRKLLIHITNGLGEVEVWQR